jgi:hypothetical protein
VSQTDPAKTIGDSICVTGLHLSKEHRPFAAEKLLELGAKHTRLEFLWHKFEPNKGDRKYEVLEDQAGAYLDAGIEVIALLNYGTAWASSQTEDDHHFPPDDPQDFANYVKEAVTYFNGRIERFEIWNEPNVGYRFYKPNLKGDPLSFGALLKAAVIAGREACPTCQFAFGGPFFHSQIIDGHIPYLTAVQDAHPDLADYYDAMGFHPYPFYPPKAPPEGGTSPKDTAFKDMIAGIREVMAEQGAEDRPFWVTEIGWPTFNAVSALTQAAFLTRGYLSLIHNGAQPVCWYNLVNGPEPNDFIPEDAFGLMTYGVPSSDAPPEPKPSFFALQTLGVRFGDFRIARELAPTDGIPEEGFGFELVHEAGDRWWVVWVRTQDDATEMILPSLPMELMNNLGENIDLIQEPLLSISHMPIYARME